MKSFVDFIKKQGVVGLAVGCAGRVKNAHEEQAKAISVSKIKIQNTKKR